MTVKITYFVSNDTKWVEHSNIDIIDIIDDFVVLFRNSKLVAGYNIDKILSYVCY